MLKLLENLLLPVRYICLGCAMIYKSSTENKCYGNFYGMQVNPIIYQQIWFFLNIEWNLSIQFHPTQHFFKFLKWYLWNELTFYKSLRLCVRHIPWYMSCIDQNCTVLPIVSIVPDQYTAPTTPLMLQRLWGSLQAYWCPGSWSHLCISILAV